MTPISTGASTEKDFHLGHRPALDGLRGIAVLFVLLAHLQFLDPRIGDNIAFVAVNTFFVLSGFLITSLLIAEWSKFRDISLKNFYWRRALRLLPALIAMLAVFTLCGFLTDPPKRAVRQFYEALCALFYFTNWAQIFRIGRSDIFGHTWTLSIEEQFYLIWPPVLLWLLRRNSRTSLLWWTLLAALLSWLIRISLLAAGTMTLQGNVFDIGPGRMGQGTDTRADSLLLGCCAGIVLSSNLLPRGRRIELALKTGAGISLLGFAFLIAVPWVLDRWMMYVGWFLASVFAAVLILRLVALPHGLLPRALENPVLVYFGKISYGLYLWHSPILRFAQTHHWPYWNLVSLPLIAAVTLASYYLLELPCLRLKKRFQRAG